MVVFIVIDASVYTKRSARPIFGTFHYWMEPCMLSNACWFFLEFTTSNYLIYKLILSLFISWKHMHASFFPFLFYSMGSKSQIVLHLKIMDFFGCKTTDYAS